MTGLQHTPPQNQTTAPTGPRDGGSCKTREEYLEHKLNAEENQRRCKAAAWVVDSNGDSPLYISGRELWTLHQLIEAGPDGITPLSNPAMRLASYVFRLRGRGVVIETEREAHGGDFPGEHARYRLASQIRLEGNV